MSRRAQMNEVAILRRDTSGFDVVDVSAETRRWAQRECGPERERRTIRKPFVATIEKVQHLCGPVLRVVSAGGVRPLGEPRGRRDRTARQR